MIKQFIDKLLGKRRTGASTAAPRARRSPAAAKTPAAGHPLGQRNEVPARAHGIDPTLVDRRAQEVVHTLQDAGYEAYIVGGAVRDLLLGLRPKDFDVATNATPEQVKSLFRRAFIIGRRFRIVHVVFGRGREHEVIEVTTFRGFTDSASAERVHGNEKTSRQALAGVRHAVDSSGRVLRDNVWGSQQEDAARRDFSINAMYYDPRSQTVVDYHGGIGDARQRTIRMIGNAETRYREDPVRMLRAIRFAAKLDALGFTLDSATARPIALLLPLLEDIPPSRMFDEMLKLLQTGHALASVAQLRALGLGRGVYPLLDLAVARADWPLVHLALQDTDRRVAEGKPVVPSFLLACLLWDDVQTQWERALAQGEHPTPALSDAISDVFERRVGEVSGRGKLGAEMREIWMMQPRFERRTGKAPLNLIEQPRFRAGLDFLRLRARTGEPLQALVQWWEALSLADDDARADLLEQARLHSQQAGGGGKSKSSRRTRKPAATPDADAADAPSATCNNSDDSAPHAAPQANDATDAPAAKKRRRRRRKPAAQRPDGSDGSNGSEANSGNGHSAAGGEMPQP
ncbi:polynucleotide adenylyltransferase PcnB [Allofranklinella schreckenbergeri]|uniref:Poly(A) polymerase I n=1 Tax=Allofranklinella schreckenbergeri TaxID=1076744 RepID=A0A3M6QW37_9BURK|nr:polynucleotide adenylyltransferase PcnB [Allofranklinella schreckenbergeri]RMX07236.1 polynucleotide adenylyltransferase PcnB [Allofranklinella schreckenbergeri]